MSVLTASIIIGFVVPALVMIVAALLEPLLKRYHDTHHPA